MRFSMKPRTAMGLWLASLLAVAPARAAFSEGFDNAGPVSAGQHGPSNLIASGWIFRNQSQPTGSGTWSANSQAPQSGAASLRVGATVAGAWSATTAASSWAILPAVPGQVNGDVLRFHMRNDDLPCCAPQARLQVRYSPSGVTSTGLGASSVGSFTTLLLDLPDLENTAWTQHSVAVPGNGRLAFRFFVAEQSTSAAFTGDAAIDSLTVGPPDAGPFPVPLPGETVTWTPAMNPIVIQGAGVTIPSGGTIVVQPGAHVQVMANSSIRLEGTLIAAGSSSSPVKFDAVAVYPPMIEVEGGTLQSSFTEFRGQVRPSANGTLLISDTSFHGPNGVVFGDLFMGTGYAAFERVTFEDSELTVSNYTLKLRNITLNNSTTRLIRDYPFLSDLTANGKGIAVDATPQGTRLDKISVSNVTSAPDGQGGSTGFGLGLIDGNFLIAPGVKLDNNTYPVQIYSAGILPGSTLPATGNINDLIYVPGMDHSGKSTIWSDAGVPYFIPDFYAQHGGSLKILEGARVKLAAGVGMSGDPSYVAVYGTNERPVTFERADPGAAWETLEHFYRIRHAVIDGATVGATWPFNLGWGFLDSSVVRNSTHLGAFDAGIIRKTLFQNNAYGASVLFGELDLNGDTNPNGFEGNGVGVTVAGNARNNWWGSSTGPAAADNPGGTGDPVAPNVPYLPFRTSRPDFFDAPPIVDLERHSFLARPGEPFILTWKARDDGSIVSQRVLMSKDGDIVQGNLQEPVMVLADNLPASRNSIEFVMPEPLIRIFGAGNIRVEATDNAGQIGWDDLHIYAEVNEPGKLALTTPEASAVHAGDDLGPVCWEPTDINPLGGSIGAYLLLENTGEYIDLGGVTTYLTCLSGTLTAPFVSTDRARIVLSLSTFGGVAQPEYFYGPEFAIRTDPRVGDAPPMVSITSPGAGSAVGSGATLPIRWTAGDDESIHVFHIQVSSDDGRTWSFIARDLPGSSRTYDWHMPPFTGNYALRVKVIAVDANFQDSSDVEEILLVAQAPGEASVTDPMTANRGAGTEVSVSYSPACGAIDHVVYQGTGPIVGAPSWTASACALGIDGSASFDLGTPPPGKFFYFVIVGQDGTSEGSYGRGSSGVERTEASDVGTCDRPRAFGSCAP